MLAIAGSSDLGRPNSERLRHSFTVSFEAKKMNPAGASTAAWLALRTCPVPPPPRPPPPAVLPRRPRAPRADDGALLGAFGAAPPLLRAAACTMRRAAVQKSLSLIVDRRSRRVTAGAWSTETSIANSISMSASCAIFPRGARLFCLLPSAAQSDTERQPCFRAPSITAQPSSRTTSGLRNRPETE